MRDFATVETACGDISWAAQFLGMSKRRFSDRRRNLEAEGFPKRDPLLNIYIKADVEAWLENRRTVPEAAPPEPAVEPMVIDFNEL
ncbi:hypothetical protein [Pseudooceanicola sp. HF7]|uniref:hypothetical protein n=1 Tax=Pseudooceanicola sp. HF7 TaxID=2721560 RepID=UPI00143137A5|nr:hypothetical protein [Pseudooceanicola sp. HF7]NIZ10164.1 hypothetical protein [Pseudooceanicola sp. HF7]